MDSTLRELLSRRVGAAILLLALAGAAQAEMLTLGRIDTPSPQTDISERVIDEACRRIGVAVEYRRLPLLRSIESANDGLIDGDTQRIADIAHAYPNLVIVPTPINLADMAVYATTPAIVGRSHAEIARLRLGITRGMFVVGKYGVGMTLIEAQRTDGLFEMLYAGRVDAVIALYLNTETARARGELPGLTLWPHMWLSEPLYLVLNKRDAALVPALDGALQQMKKEGLIDAWYADAFKRLGIHRLGGEPARPGPPGQIRARPR